MIKLSKLTDYGFVVMMHFVRLGESVVLTAKDVSDYTKLPLPTVSKILKVLSKNNILVAKRGVKGGYQLRSNPSNISIVSVIESFEGPIALTNCVTGVTRGCLAKELCENGPQWKVINNTIRNAMLSVSLYDLMKK